MQNTKCRAKRKRPVTARELAKLALTLRELALEFEAMSSVVSGRKVEVDGAGLPALANKSLRAYLLNCQRGAL
jgi:hypothetical protein